MKKEKTIYFQKQKIFNFFLFINTKSGNGQGKSYLSQNFRAIKYKYESNRTAIVNLCDLFNKEQKHKNIKLIKQLKALKDQNIRVVISGGDGTILWVVNQIKNNDIDISDIVFGINPIGTGNDFSRSVGWGYTPIKGGKNIANQLAKQVLKWMNAQIGYYDLWDVEVQTFQNGSIYDIKDQIQIRKSQTIMKKTFSNYVGIGLDARVVYTVQRKRTKSAFFNKVVYGLIGFCYFFKSMKKLEEVMDSFIIQQKNEMKQIDNLKKSASFDDEIQISDLRSMIYKKDSKQHAGEEESIKYPIKNGYRGLVCLNCPSYMAGLRHVWETKSIASKNQEQTKKFTSQKFDDGKIQFVGFKNQLNLALQRIMRSGARVAQGGGPFKVLMKKNSYDQDTYMQIDGQSIRVVNLKSVRISKSEIIQGGKLKIMINNDEL